MNMIILIIVLLLLFGGVGPWWNHSHSWGYAPSGIIGFIVLVLVVLWLMGHRF